MHSTRLSYRLFDFTSPHLVPEDVDTLWQIDQDPEVMRYLTKGEITSRETLMDTFIPRIQSYTDLEKGYGMWRVGLKENDLCIGEIIIRPMYFFSAQADYTNIELGWRFIRQSWGKGYATEAAQFLMQHIAERNNVSTFTAIADTNNKASLAVMQKLGMTFLKNDIHQDPLGDCEVDFYQVTL